ncbi:MAG: CmpA/NrtA family ABC transporter substrate-binding protein [Planctomycetota bacterium]
MLYPRDRFMTDLPSDPAAAHRPGPCPLEGPVTAPPLRPEKRELTLGIIPLTDCAPIVVAHEKGFFQRHGLDVTIAREGSWASIRDKLVFGLIDAAHMLAPMPLAISLGVSGPQHPVLATLSLDLNGNAITVSNDLYAHMAEADADALSERPTTARALKAVIERRKRRGMPPLTLGVVFPASTHNFQLRYWLAEAGIDPDRDAELVVVPPPRMVDHLRQGRLDGFCVGEPWNSVAVRAGAGKALITSYELWNNGPEKVLGVTRQWAEAHPQTHRAVIRALLEAAAWIDEPGNRDEVTGLLARPEYVGVSPETIGMSMTGTFQYALDQPTVHMPDFNVFHRYTANYPWRSHAVWMLTQMARWGQIAPDTDFHAIAEQVYDPTVCRAAAGDLGMVMPVREMKPEGSHHGPWTSDAGFAMGPDAFFDRQAFDPEQAESYLEGFAIRRQTVSSS